MNLTKVSRLGITVAALWTIGVAAQQHTPSQDIIDAVQAAIVTSGKSAEDGPLIIEQPARNYYHFGAVMNRQHIVLAVTPDSDADKAGVVVGDKLLQINNAAVNSTSLEDVLALLNDFEEGKPFSVWVNRAGKAIKLHSTVTRRTIPGWRLEINPAPQNTTTNINQTTGCSFISVFFSPPPSMEIFPATIRMVGETDFRDQPFRNTDVIKIAAGKQKIELLEHIPLGRFRRNPADIRSRHFTQPLELNLEPNKVYHLASRYITDIEERTDPAQYWEPLVWKVEDRQCE
ncbi:PDZ domain-containing protein [Arsukibacterium sp. UBA3155]|uniref:PDZ domain-containing protein n=1 Tax=Arsukibacterium sp. UBA3155 TaxID=1946058 RepID=UPI0025BCC5AA|nr:PDZ domain-containing protein [Arsukibacterium sp. UBA3155]|tara:strand:+ start:102378 stop:103241 length:864 start_codon:yes stop_codon:yes gene_type:complete